MLKLYNKEHEAIGVLTNLKDYKIEYVLSGEDLLEFSLSISDENIYLVEEEGYIRTKDNEYVIKAIDPSDNFKRFSCNVNIEALVGKAIASFDTSNNNVNDTIRLAIAGTGWILADNNITKRRTVRLTNTNALEVLREVRKVFRVDFRYDAINKIIYVYEQFGEERGVYFSDELNLKSFSIPSDTYDYVTRLYPKGKDGLTIASINNGKEYIENFQYSNKVLELIWEDNRYTDVNSLKEDAEFKLDELSKPKRTYQAGISDLAKQSDEYSFLDFFLGDTITLLSKQEKFRDKQRIVKYIQYPNDSSQNSCELGNTTLTFEELQHENEAKNNTVDAITSDNGTINGSKVDSITTEQISDFEASVAKITDLTVINAEINNLKVQNVTITGELNAVKGEFGTLKANVGVIDNLTVTHTAQINNLEVTKASITQLEAVSAIIGTVEAEVGKIQTLVNGNLSSENIQAGGITSDKLTIANGFITNAMIASLDVSKVNAGDISTNKFRIKSDDGGIEIVGATQQFKDKNNKVRVQIGKDTQGNFNFIIKGEDGTTTLIDHTGVKAGAIADNLIISDMIANDAVGEKQINYSSFVTGFNKDTNTSTIKSTKIMLNNQNQTLDIAFNSLKTQADGTKSITESHSTTIGVMQGQISTAINNTKIVKDGQTILLKDDYNRTVATIDSMKSTIGSHTSQISGLNSTVSTQGSSIEQLKGQIALKVEQTDITNAINNLEIGGRNYALGTQTFISKTGENKENQGVDLYSLNKEFAGNTVTTSFDWEVTGDIISGTFYTQLNASPWTNFSDSIIVSSTNKKGRVVCTRKVPLDLGSAKMIKARLDNFQGTLKISNLKIEIGNKATDWSPAPEDIDNNIDTKINSAKAEIKVTTDAISQNVSNLSQTVSTKADGSTVTTLSNKVGSLETSVNGISGKVTNLEKTTTTLGTQISDAQDVANSAINKANSAQSTANTANSTANANKGNITNLQGEVSTVKSNIASLEVTTSGISQKVSSVESTTATLTTKVTTAQNTANQAKTDASNAQSTANSANSNATNALNKVNDANLKIDNLEIGSSNLILGTKDFTIDNSRVKGWYNSGNFTITQEDGCKIATHSVSGLTSSSIKGLYSSYISCKKGDTFTVSVYVKVENINNWDTKIPLIVEGYNATKTRIEYVDVSINHNGSNKPTLVNNEWVRFVYTYTITNIDTVFFGIRLSLFRNGKISFKKAQIEKGNKPTDWTPAQEDVQSQIDTHTTQITTTNNKVSEIKTDLSSITSRVGTVESKQTTTDGKVTSLETWKKSAENKITESAIISTVSTEFYKKGETDNKYASQTQITQLSNQISSKVDVNGVKTVIQQNPESVMIGFNNISDSFLVNEHGLLCNNTNGNKSIAIQKGNLYYYNQYDNSKFLGGIIPRITTSDYLKGFGVLASKHCNTFQISHTDQWDNDSQWEIPGTIYPDFWINYKDITSNRGDLKGIHLGMTTYADNNILGNQSNSISGFNSISATSMCYDHWRSLVDNSIVARFDGGTNKILLGKNLNGNGFILENFASVNVSKIYLDSVYAYNGNYGKILFRTDGWNMYNGVNWDWQGYNILSPNIIGGSYGYSATLSSTRSYKTSIDTSSILDCINIVEPINTFSKSSKSSLEMDISQLINHPNADMFIYRNTNNVDMKSMLHLALLEIQKLKKEVQEIRAS